MVEKNSGMTQSDHMHDKLQPADRVQEETDVRNVNEELISALRTKNAKIIAQAVQMYVHKRCPKCSEPLQERPYRRIKVDECPGCHGIWLDKGELEILVGPKADQWLQRFYEAFIPAKP
ncbi:MAG: hypothetical protein ETSY1_01665 [Candidatus Entotheonella factor]|uniref:Transcription factor zinc-finger domain-containing protein n=1 Tax=Entotheonella factor TaxID=1429438 RepID=W4M006_ENTF1|nr:MAG: hypothetical protein ETSY1_01665 [Candidatus Entotheonella factor]